MTLVYYMLPAYNEEENLPDLLKAIAQVPIEYEIVLVNDGSSDRTGEIAREFAKEMPITVIDHDVNKGLGGALRTGLIHIAREGKEDSAVVTMDSDLTHDPQLIVPMLKILNSGYDIVVASRYVAGGEQLNLPLSRRTLSWGINMLIRMKGSKVRDNTSGFRCIRYAVLKKAIEKFGGNFINTREFTSAVLVLLRLQSVGARPFEYPICLDYGLKRGASKMNVPRTIRAYLRLLLAN
ncbi:MAG: glycosyltransferase family 2 protein [Candidatus Thorarchaeota archaeon]|nr:glycosyltransferase family 2 protein [Candidatus Thorarchaeota archaeon]